MASTYASLINAPLIIKDSVLDDSVECAESSCVFNNIDVVLVGDVECPTGVICSEVYDLNELQQRYVDVTGTGKIILVNPNDLSISINSDFIPKVAPYDLSKLYSKTSLVAPFLASAKYQVIVSKSHEEIPDRGDIEGAWTGSNPATDAVFEEKIDQFDSLLNSKISTLGITPKYLTVVAAQNAIPSRIFIYKGAHTYYRALDATQYADIDLDQEPDMAVGRIQGITVSDASSHVARSIFYDSFDSLDSVKFVGSSIRTLQTFIPRSKEYASIFAKSGYDSAATIDLGESVSFDPSEWEDQSLTVYHDHGTGAFAGISSGRIPRLKNSVVMSHACATCNLPGSFTFCSRVIRQGGIMNLGTVSVSSSSDDTLRYMLNGIYSRDLTIGEAFDYAYEKNAKNTFSILLADPTLKLNVPYNLVRGV